MASRPQFTGQGLEGLKKMVANSNPEEVGNVAGGWKKVRNSLVGEDWNSGIKKHFDDAVTKVLQTWHGSSADQFAKQAQKISQNFANLAPYPHNTGHVLEQIAERLAQAKGFVEGVKEPSTLERAADRLHDFSTSGTGKIAAFVPGGAGVAAVSDMLGITGDGRDDSGLNKDLANPKMSIWDAMNKNRDNLSIDRERSLQAAHYMEQLATTYRAGVSALGSGPRVGDDDRIHAPGPGDGGGGTMPPFVPFGPTPSGPKTGVQAPNMPGMNGGSGYKTPPAMEVPRPHGIDGGIGDLPKAPATPIKTGLEGLQGGSGLGAGGAPGIGGGGVGGGVGTGGLGSGVGSGSGSGIGGSGMPGMPGGVGIGAGAGGRGGGSGAGAGAGARGSRPGMPGMGGAAGGKGAGAKGAGSAGKGSPLARQKGGVVGGKVGKSGAGTQGGSGLHRSRGGTQQGAAGGRRPTGGAGAPGAHGAKGKDKGNANGQRPDYLVEDEETWTPERSVAPKVIE
ncbi:hypothetical protein AB0C11_14630 [Streptomyces sp. NPDC039016]|uniref:WXG100 family type VII secretion target n=1 Tax=Streptomyces sp. NPDC039016 TaxID=3154330 RepID=UPI0033C1C6C4